jgi:hypothetical protein
MTRCKGTTVGGRRCKRKAGHAGDFCAIHTPSSSILEETEQEIVQIELFKDGDMTQRLCGHCCDITLEKCCICADLRPNHTKNKSHGYCGKCKRQYSVLNPPPPAPAPRNFIWYPDENPEDNIAFNIFLRMYSARRRGEN